MVLARSAHVYAVDMGYCNGTPLYCLAGTDATLAVSLQTEDMFFDPDDMDKFADEGTMDDDLEGAWRVRGKRALRGKSVLSIS